MYFPGDFVKFIKTSFLCNISGRRYLVILSSKTIDLPRYNGKKIFLCCEHCLTCTLKSTGGGAQRPNFESISEFFCFFLSGFSFTDTVDSQDSRRREGTIFYSALPLPPAHEH